MVINIVTSFFSIFIFLFTCNLFLSPKYPIRRILLLNIIFVVLKAFLPIRIEPHLNLVFTIFLFMFIIFIFFNGQILSKITLVLGYLMCSAIFELLTMKILSLFYESMVLVDNFAYLVGVLLSNLFLVLTAYLISQYKIASQLEIPNYSWITLILPITSIIFILSIQDYYIVTEKAILPFVIIGLLLSNYMIIFIYQKILKEITDKNQLSAALIESNNKYERVNALLQQHNVFLHNIRKQSQDMIDLLKQENYQELENYIDHVYSETTTIYNMINSNSEIFDIIINDRLFLIQNNNIHLRVKLESTNFGAFSNNELYKLFSLLIDLGISECLKANNISRNLIVKSKQIGKQTILTTVFPLEENISKNEIYKSMITLLDQYKLEYLLDESSESNNTSFGILFTEGEF